MGDCSLADAVVKSSQGPVRDNRHHKSKGFAMGPYSGPSASLKGSEF